MTTALVQASPVINRQMTPYAAPTGQRAQADPSSQPFFSDTPDASVMSSCWAELLESDRKFFLAIQEEIKDLSSELGQGTIADSIHAALVAAYVHGEAVAKELYSQLLAIQTMLNTGQGYDDWVQILSMVPPDRWPYVVYVAGCGLYVQFNPKRAFWDALQRRQDALIDDIAKKIRNPQNAPATLQGTFEICTFICSLANRGFGGGDDEVGWGKFLIPALAFAGGYYMGKG